MPMLEWAGKKKIVNTIGIFGFALLVLAQSTLASDPPHVFWVHGANVTAEGAQVWASEMFKRLWQAGARMEFHAISWDSDLGADWDYHINVSNAFVTAARLSSYVNGFSGRRVVIAHSLGTMVAASAIQDHAMQVDKFIMLDSAIPSEAFDASLSDANPSNHLVQDEWMEYRSECWTSRWHELFPTNDARHNLTWKNRFNKVAPVAINFYSSGDEVLAIYTDSHNPPTLAGAGDSSTKGRWAWHKQEIFKGRKGFIDRFGTTDWAGWGFGKTALGFRKWSAEKANAVTECSVFRTNMVFRFNPPSMNNPNSSRLETDFHLAQGIPALSPATGITDLSRAGITSIDMNDPDLLPNGYDLQGRHRDFAGCVLHSDVKDVAYYYLHKVFSRIVKEGNLR